MPYFQGMKAQFIEVGTPAAKTIHIKKINTDYLQSPFHFHDLCELVWIQESHGKRIVGDHVDHFLPGDLVLMGPNLPHIWLNDASFRDAPVKGNVKSIVVYFPANFLQQLSEEEEIIAPVKRLIERAERGVRFTGDTQQQVIQLLAGITRRKGLGKLLDFMRILELLTDSAEFEYLSSIQFENSFQPKDTARINVVYQYLMNNFPGDISLDDVAALANMTPPAFCRYFKKHTGKSLTRFINEIRIGHACKLLLDEDRSIGEICYESGYQNLTNFNKFFREIKGENPSQYRKSMRTSTHKA